jgi:O-antigen ligase
MWLGFISGVAASVWSQTRGGWVAVMLIFGWVVLHALKGLTLHKRVMALIVLIGCIALPVWQLELHKVIASRVSTAAEEFQAYVDVDKQNTSVGSRLAVWKFILLKVDDAPWLGQGQYGWVKLRDQGIADGVLHQYVGDFGHVHNEYLDVLLKRGIAGVGLLMLLYVGPLLWFFKPYLKDTDVEVKSLAMAGMVIPMMYMDFGLTQLFLGHNSGRMVLVSLWMCAAALLLNANEKVNH